MEEKEEEEVFLQSSELRKVRESRQVKIGPPDLILATPELKYGVKWVKGNGMGHEDEVVRGS